MRCRSAASSINTSSVCERFAQQPVSDPQPAQPWILPAKPRRQLQQIIVTLQIKQSRDRADHNIVIADPQSLARLRTWNRRIEERAGLHPAVDRYVLTST